MSHLNKENLEVVTVAGNRPEIIKLSELVNSLNGRGGNAFVYTGQHYSANMRDVFFKELNVRFDYDLKSNTSDINKMREMMRNLLHELQPSYVIVYGDTNSTVAGALAAKDQNCKLIHIEAGLRCFDLSKAEERNRILVDSISDYLLAPTVLNELFLKYEYVPQEKIFVTGNLIVDVCKKFSTASASSNNQKGNFGTEYILVTLHRPALVDDPQMLKKLSSFLSQINYKLVFPVHPRTKDRLAKYNIDLPKNVTVIDAVGYVEFLSLLKKCKMVLTDSGGVQEEAITLKKPCITLNSTTERQETILLRANRLYFPLDIHDENSQNSINRAIEEMLHTKITINPYGENVTARAFKVISDIIDGDKVEIKPELQRLPEVMNLKSHDVISRTQEM